MATVQEVKVIVKAEVDEAIKRLQGLEDKLKGQAVSAKELAKEFASELVPGLMKFAGPAGAVVAAAEGINRLVEYMKECVAEFEQADQTSRKLEAIIKATGGAAGKSAEDMTKLAESTAKATGFEADQVKNLEALMATFKSVKGDVFDRAIADAADLAAAFGQDLSGSAIQLGKALEDPVQGITALRRVGVTYSEQEREQIKDLVEHNKLLEAQEIVLRGLEGQVKGTAAAMQDSASGAHKALKNADIELKEARGELIAMGMRPYWEWLTKIKEAQTEHLNKEINLQHALHDGKANYDEAIATFESMRGTLIGTGQAAAYANVQFEEQLQKLKNLRDSYKLLEEEANNPSSILFKRKAYTPPTDTSYNMGLSGASDWSFADRFADMGYARPDNNQAGVGFVGGNPDFERAQKLQANTAGSIMDVGAAVDDTSTALDAYLDYLKEAALTAEEAAAANAKVTAELQAMGAVVGNSLVGGFEQLGAAMGIGQLGAKSFAKTMVAMIGQMVMGFGTLIEAEALASWPISDWSKFAGGAAMIMAGSAIKAAAASLATGGTVKARPGGTIVRLGEGGEDEFVVPRSKVGFGGRSLVINVNNHIAGSILADRALTATIVKTINDMERAY